MARRASEVAPGSAVRWNSSRSASSRIVHRGRPITPPPEFFERQRMELHMGVASPRSKRRRCAVDQHDGRIGRASLGKRENGVDVRTIRRIGERGSYSVQLAGEYGHLDRIEDDDVDGIELTQQRKSGAVDRNKLTLSGRGRVGMHAHLAEVEGGSGHLDT